MHGGSAHRDLVSFEVVSVKWVLSSTAEAGLSRESGRLELSDTDLHMTHA